MKKKEIKLLEKCKKELSLKGFDYLRDELQKLIKKYKAKRKDKTNKGLDKSVKNQSRGNCLDRNMSGDFDKTPKPMEKWKFINEGYEVFIDGRPLTEDQKEQLIKGALKLNLGQSIHCRDKEIEYKLPTKEDLKGLKLNTSFAEMVKDPVEVKVPKEEPLKECFTDENGNLDAKVTQQIINLDDLTGLKVVKNGKVYTPHNLDYSWENKQTIGQDSIIEKVKIEFFFCPEINCKSV